MATLIYTSGTTGRPKGCELTHRNFLFEIGNGMSLLGRFLNVDGSTAAVPPAGARARPASSRSARSRPARVVGHTPDVKNLVDDLGEFKPTFVLAVPRVFEKVFNTAKQQGARPTARARSSTRPRRWPSTGRGRWTRAAPASRSRPSTRCSTSWSTASCAPPSAAAAWARSPAAPRSATGSATSSAASASPSSRATASPRPPPPPRSTTTTRCAIGTVGRPLPGVDVAIADDGEVLIRGGIVLRGYWKNEDATEEAIDADGWFHTGDLGELDDDGFLKITGRKKEILVTAGGKNVAPAVLEDRLRAHGLVSQCIVVGDQRPFIAALITLDEEALPHWLESKGKPKDQTAEQVERRPGAARRDRGRGRRTRTRRCRRPRRSRSSRILGTDFTEENGMLTPSLKLKRSVVMKEFDDEVEKLYTPVRTRSGLEQLGEGRGDRRPATSAARPRPGRPRPSRAPGPGRPAGRRSRRPRRPATRGSTTCPVTPSRTASGRAAGRRRPPPAGRRRRLQEDHAETLDVQPGAPGAAGHGEHVPGRVVRRQLARAPPAR